MRSFTDRRRRLAEAMERHGTWPARSPWIREAVDALPRHLFAPDRLWRWDGHAYVPLDRTVDASRWADEVYADPDAAAVTQVTDGRASSSLSCQGVVVDMLDSLLLEPGQRTLELGAGTGWNAALLAYRAGPGRVTSVEVDSALASAAGKRLEAVAAEVAVEVGDGTAGWSPGAPYDRVISTYAVDRVPWAWVEQTRPGGRIVTPWGRLGHVALTVSEDGRSASGWVQGLAQFMPARGAGRGFDSFGEVRGDRRSDSLRPWGRELAPLRNDWHLIFALRVALPDVRITTSADADGLNAWFHDGASSWASLSAQSDGTTVAHQGGPRRLANELEQAWDMWLDAGEPDLYDYGLTVESTGHQYAWALDPESGPRWPSAGL
ncbi:methyltransferase domain-containing protein [Streptomyces sp. NPDC004609]|uniref:methyltransferase domain-containing protein n=1 Tax=Streptomyces sp. NPDC004609 TaxID=3364704 RepID=UPI00368A15BE